MNRNLCMLSTSRGRPFLIVCRFNNGVLMIARAEEIKPKVVEQGGVKNKIVSVDNLVNKELSEYHEKGYVVAVDEDIPRYSLEYQHTPLLQGEAPIFVEAFRSYIDLFENNKIVFRKGVTEIRAQKVSEAEMGDGGKLVYRIDGDELSPARAALILASYHAQNADITDINFMRSLFQGKPRLPIPKVRGRHGR